ncbi:molybdopterin molybdotransferase MoeA [Pseudoxanthomonas sacheonensis]|uniref:Molybdopterin molybdenumtransferase n=1 Tax=Pseudoxanthomonas sacheonensis TaxID=443615 RepID=A0ABU1RPF0_9GAMM|nr:gephyrin-like molybdotransferase Glp [Pseudoxanthomonas sacheonensis]MDR6840654.1 molybdopterin molybdotransferase [Pseudoxanthomonas sacheonensis]
MGGFPTRISYDDASRIVDHIASERRLAHERLAIKRVDGRILAQDLTASISLPAFDNSRMDGFALRHADLNPESGTELRIVGAQFAGPLLDQALQSGQCIRITTGAPLPEGADTVVIKEETHERDGLLTVPAGVAAGADIRRAGEDVRVGEVVLGAGSVLFPARVSLAAALGVAELEVSQRPTVAVFTTGDELVEPGLPLLPGQIYNSNRELLMGLLRAEGLEPVAWPTLPDDPARIETALRDAASAFDLVITCGGVSAGEKDHLPALLAAQGGIHFWKVKMKPGMPVLFGNLDQALFLGLPGNPVSVLATFLTLGRRLLDGLQGRAEPRAKRFARLTASWNKSHERLEFLRGRLQYGQDGVLGVAPNSADASHRLRAAADSDVLIVLGEGAQEFPIGSVVEVLVY